MKIFCVFLFTLLLCSCTKLTTRTDLEKAKPSILDISLEPIVRVDVSHHSNIIKSIALDPLNDYLVTGSYDKTVKIWTRKSGKLLRTLRLPIGKGKEGRIYTVAISPNGKHIACAGWTGIQWDRKACIYIFDTETGEIIQRISNLPNVVHCLAYSKLGKYLVAGLGGQSGIKIYDSKVNYDFVAQDRYYNDSVYGVDFDKRGYLVTTCYDGLIRLYNPEFKLEKSTKADGRFPYKIAFSPDGNTIALAYRGETKLQLLTKDIEIVGVANVNGLNGNLHNVCWSADGYLYASGDCQDQITKKFIIRKWVKTDNIYEDYKDLLVSNSPIEDMVILRDHGIAFATAEPSMGELTISDQIKLYKSDIVNFRGTHQNFKVSSDGVLIEFLIEGTLFGFSLESSEVDIKSQDKTKNQPITSGLDIKNWENHPRPTYNNTILQFNQNEISRCLAISPNKDYFVLGTDSHLRIYDVHGNPYWKEPIITPGITWAVNIAQNKKAIIAAFSDGTIRWYRLEDGEEFLALLYHRNKRDWVTWTPSGYYNESSYLYIGQHLNNSSEDSADFLPMEKENRSPFVVAKAFIHRAGDVQTTPEDPDYPPIVEIVTPTQNQNIFDQRVKVKFIVKSKRDKVEEIEILIDDKKVPTEEPKEIDRSLPGRELEIVIPPRNCAITIIAKTKYAASVPATVNIIWQGELEKPSLYILAIGITNYNENEQGFAYLPFAAQDAKDFATVLEEQNDLYKKIEVKQILNEEATRKGILNGFEWLKRNAEENDMVMVFLSGHGQLKDNTYYFVPIGVREGNLFVDGVSDEQIMRGMETLKASRSILFMDSCYAGGLIKSGFSEIGPIIEAMKQARGVIVFASSSPSEPSRELAKLENGVFTKVLIDGLKGKADYENTGTVTIEALRYYIPKEVRRLTDNKQNPIIRKPDGIQDFPITFIKK